MPANKRRCACSGVPVVGVLASALALGEPLTAAKLVGLGLIGAGVAVLAIAGTGAAEPAG